MKEYISRITHDRQWEIMKMVIGSRDVQMLLTMIEDGYRLSVELFETLHRLRYDELIEYIAINYLNERQIWSFLKEILGREKVEELIAKKEIKA